MITIHKYTLPVERVAHIEMPRGAELLTVQMQRGVPCVWARVDTNDVVTPRKLLVVGTGHDAPPASTKYLGTFQVEDFVFHVFDLGIER